MAKKYLTHIDLNKNELQNAVIQPLASAPSTPTEGQIYYNTTDDTIYVWANAAWLDLGVQGGAGATDLSQSLTSTTVAINSNTGADTTILAADGTNAGVMTSAQFTKLAGIATGATANSSDATLLARANHTGSQTAATISDFDAEVSNNADVAANTGARHTHSNSAVLNATTASFLTADETKLDGIATGATANSSDATLLARANHTGSQTASTISDFSTAADARITNAAGTSIASLTAGKVPTSQLPAISLTTVQTAASQVAQLALTAQAGDVVVRTDENKTYMHNGGVAGTMADYTLLNSPADAVTSVAGQTGVVVLSKSDVGLANVDNTSDANKPVSTAQATADGLRALKSSNLSDLANATTAFTNIKQDASTTATGVVELATVAEAQAKTDTTRALTAASVADFARKYTGTIGNGSLTSLPVTHGLGTQDIVVSVRDATTNDGVECDWKATSTTTATFTFATAPATNAYKVVIIG